MTDFFSELDLLQAISVPFDDPKHVYFAEGLHGLHAFGLRAGWFSTVLRIFNKGFVRIF